MIRARLVREQTCSSAIEMVAGAALALSMADSASDEDSVSSQKLQCC